MVPSKNKPTQSGNIPKAFMPPLRRIKYYNRDSKEAQNIDAIYYDPRYHETPTSVMKKRIM